MGGLTKYLHLRPRLDRFYISTFKMYIIVRFQYELEWVGRNPSVPPLVSLDVSYNEQLYTMTEGEDLNSYLDIRHFMKWREWGMSQI